MSLLSAIKRVLQPKPSTKSKLERRAKPTHRSYVGGNWQKIGKLQFDFLKSQGLQPHHTLLDIACGSLRAGRFLIKYLEPGRYLGLDKEQWLIDAGVANELEAEVTQQKQPRFVVSSSFEFEKFGVQIDYAWAQSLFTHLTPELIMLCLRNLRACIKPDGVFYASFFEAAKPFENPDKPDDQDGFWYTAEQMREYGEKTGWSMKYIGTWAHPRGQMMVEYRPK